MTTNESTTRMLHANLGEGIVALVNARDLVTHQDDIALGKQIDALIGTVVKAVLEGRQTNAQIRAKQQVARQAFARALARKVAKL